MSALSFVLTLIPSAFLFLFLFKLANWLNLTLFPSKSGNLDLSAYGGNGRSKRAWALITGASDGIGAAFAKELAKQKFNLFLVGRNLDKLERVKTEILSETGDIKVNCLISEASDSTLQNIENLFAQVEASLPSVHCIRILINNVGMGQNGKRRLGEIDVFEGGEGRLFEEIVKVNCIYPVILTRAFLRRLKGDNGQSAIINIASCAALTPATPFSSLYAATKSFNRSFSLSLSGEMSAKHLLHPETTPKVDVICVSPGFVVSNMTKMRESAYCCSAQDHALVVFSKISKSWPLGSVDIIPHWKHGLVWSILAVLEVAIPSEWFLVAIVMPAMLKFSGKFRNFKIKE